VTETKIGPYHQCLCCLYTTEPRNIGGVPSEASSPCTKILAKNCRGLSRASTICSLMCKICNHSPDVLFLSETKLQSSHAIAILNILGFFMMSHAPSSGSKGELLLSWHHGVDLECFFIFC
jgi:hypothetical protein